MRRETRFRAATRLLGAFFLDEVSRIMSNSKRSLSFNQTISEKINLNAEEQRLAEYEEKRALWKRWGTYVSERAWGTVREDYSADGSAWEHFPFEHAHLRAFRWNEDGLAGFCDRNQAMCFSVGLWNGRDPIIKERLFG
ncbi:MAG: hypothetical protein H7Z37_10705, partial [Pyrinomonadaceae bacterium]|nr:hypothetical protein [Pyrinomonadaceae bacterium]